MKRYFFIESRDPFESRDSFVAEMAIDLKRRGHEVTIFFVQNGVLAAREKARKLQSVTEAGVTLLADDLSLGERGIQMTELNPRIQRSPIDAIVEALVQPDTKVIWH